MENNFKRGFEKTAGVKQILNKVKKEGKEVMQLLKHFAKKENNPMMRSSFLGHLKKEYKDLRGIHKHFKNK